ncbi:hypothetical protein GZH47_22105 [Paenibacillus rhizovicinus]|uniref:ParA family protein n=1 Tax=Paenibacillus rhizovicinus TaxID=2704463 RepID=A0A6C0P4E9_9BACL|nr:hypothetical protein [Paenibacillus rhizovicinus]QHW33211.1 hypothetical protein GZH47_22105 [Paenibacillus rhizovicinus]
MNKRNLIAAVNDSDYIERLAEYIRHSSFGENWQLTAFTNAAALRGFIRSGYAIDLLAAQPAMLGELGDLPEDLTTAAFVDYYGQSKYEKELLQFQPLPQLLQAITSLYAAEGNQLPKPALRGKGPVVVTVYSASGGTGKTTLALQLARHADIAGLRSFYLNLEQWNASLPLSSDGSAGGDDFSKLLYAIQSDSDQGVSAVLAYRKRYPAYSLDAFVPCNNPDERLALGTDQAKKLIAAIAAAGNYGLIVVDLDSRMDAMHAAVFEESDAILWLTTPDIASFRKNELAISFADRKFGPEFKAQKPKFRFVQVGGALNDRTLTDGKQARMDAVLPFVEEWAGGEYLSGTGAMVPQYRGAVDALLRRLGIL